MIKQEEAFSITALAKAVSQSKRRVLKSLRRMEGMQLLPENAIDEDNGKMPSC